MGMKRYIKSAVLPLANEPYEVKQELIKDPNTSIGTLLDLQSDEDPVIANLLSMQLDKIASNSNNEDDLMTLIDAQDATLCYCIARNPNASANVLTYLYNTPICQPDCPTLTPLENGLIPYCIASNPNTPIETLQLIANTHSNDESIDSEYWEQVRQNAKDALNSRGYDI
jgi:hypothetical protein